MNTKALSSFFLSGPGLVRGCLEQRKNGGVVLKTDQGDFPVKLEGEAVSFGQELTFRILRAEPGLLVLTPNRMETLGETLPFFKELFANEEELGLKLLSAAMQEKLPLNRAVLTDLKKGLITVEKQWGLIVHPRALAFLQARSIPLTPRSLLWALYALFPTVQKVLWHKAGTADSLFPDFKREGGEREGRPDHPQTNGPAQKEVPAEICKETVAFLHQQARHDPTLPHFVYYLFPSSQEELRCTGRKFSMSTTDNDKGGNGEEDGFAFALDYQSDFFGPLQITGVYNKLGLNLTIGAEPAVLDRNLLNGLGYYLAEKGWPVRSVQFQTYQERKEELPPIFPPLRIDGWL